MWNSTCFGQQHLFISVAGRMGMMCGAFSSFFPLCSLHYVDLLKKNCLPVSQDSFWTHCSYRFVLGKPAIELAWPSCWILVASFFAKVSSRSFSKHFCHQGLMQAPAPLLGKGIHDHAELLRRCGCTPRTA